MSRLGGKRRIDLISGGTAEILPLPHDTDVDAHTLAHLIPHQDEHRDAHTDPQHDVLGGLVLHSDTHTHSDADARLWTAADYAMFEDLDVGPDIGVPLSGVAQVPLLTRSDDPEVVRQQLDDLRSSVRDWMSKSDDTHVGMFLTLFHRQPDGSVYPSFLASPSLAHMPTAAIADSHGLWTALSAALFKAAEGTGEAAGGGTPGHADTQTDGAATRSMVDAEVQTLTYATSPGPVDAWPPAPAVSDAVDGTLTALVAPSYKGSGKFVSRIVNMKPRIQPQQGAQAGGAQGEAAASETSGGAEHAHAHADAPADAGARIQTYIYSSTVAAPKVNTALLLGHATPRSAELSADVTQVLSACKLLPCKALLAGMHPLVLGACADWLIDINRYEFTQTRGRPSHKLLPVPDWFLIVDRKTAMSTWPQTPSQWSNRAKIVFLRAYAIFQGQMTAEDVHRSSATDGDGTEPADGATNGHARSHKRRTSGKDSSEEAEMQSQTQARPGLPLLPPGVTLRDLSTTSASEAAVDDMFSRLLQHVVARYYESTGQRMPRGRPSHRSIPCPDWFEASQPLIASTAWAVVPSEWPSDVRRDFLDAYAREVRPHMGEDEGREGEDRAADGTALEGGVEGVEQEAPMWPQ